MYGILLRDLSSDCCGGSSSLNSPTLKTLSYVVVAVQKDISCDFPRSFQPVFHTSPLRLLVLLKIQENASQHDNMPVSHLGLTVSHIPSATSFYLAALQPLGYRYIGQQGDAIGLGVTDADFFLCQERNGYVNNKRLIHESD